MSTFKKITKILVSIFLFEITILHYTIIKNNRFTIRSVWKNIIRVMCLEFVYKSDCQREVPGNLRGMSSVGHFLCMILEKNSFILVFKLRLFLRRYILNNFPGYFCNNFLKKNSINSLHFYYMLIYKQCTVFI